MNCLLLTGHVRSFDKCVHSILDKFCDNHTDIYACTWDDRGHYSLQEKFGIPIKKQLILTPKREKSFITIDRPDDVFTVNQTAIKHWRMGWVERLRSQWYCVKRGFELLDDYSSYDVIIRCRFDLQFTDTELDLQDCDHINIPKPNSPNLYNDHYAWGNADVMQKYCTMFDHIYDMYLKENVNISHAENMLKFYMEKFLNPVQTKIDNSEYSVIKVLHDKTRIR
tara:strand:+ start:9631 stop:10302 length:672 start_codon:yes stop_codon:yes gene_type:complete